MPAPNLTVITCPACGSTSYQATGPEASGFSGFANDEEFKQESYFVRKCSNCGLLYRTPTLSPSELERFYAVTDFRGWEITGYFRTERRVLEILRRLPKGSRILDFGCSSGRLLAELSQQYACYGVEVNEAAANEAARKGLTILRAEDLETPDLLKFDAIVLVDVFEHVSQPLALLRKLSQRLVDGGALIIATGLGDAPACRRDPAQFWYFRTVQHLSMLTREHAEFLCLALQLQLEQWNEMCHYDLPFRVKLVQFLQDRIYWQFHRRTRFARFVLALLPGMAGLKAGDVPPLFSCSSDHVVALFRKQ